MSLLVAVNIETLLPYIETAFDGDTDLPEYHISGEDFAIHTYHEIINTSKILPLTCYKVGEFGFTVTSPGLLYSFGINVEYRTAEILKLWFCELKNIMPIFDCALHGKNSRAINHLIKQGMVIKEQVIVLECH